LPVDLVRHGNDLGAGRVETLEGNKRVIRIFKKIDFDRSYEIFLPHACVSVILASIFSLAFVITPYWAILGNNIGSIPVEVAGLILTIGLGVAWSFISGGDVRVRISLKSLILLVTMVGALSVLTFHALNYAIPWRGDEDYHIKKTFSLLDIIPLNWALLTLFLYVILFYKISQKPWRLLRITAVLTVGIIPFLLFGNSLLLNPPTFLLRYPFVNYWVYAIVPKIASLITSPYQELLFRIVPFLSAAIIVWIFQSKLNCSWIMKLVWGFSCALIPIVMYYSSILYLEMPAVILMLVVCFRIKDLLHKDFNSIRQDPGWYALILIGFIKETAITFLFCFLACRIFIYTINKIKNRRLLNSTRSKLESKKPELFIKSLIGEILIVFSVLFPIFFYLLLRTYLVSIRSFVPDLSNLLHYSVYQAIGKSLVQQFGAYVFFFIGGLILLLARKEYSVTGFFILLVVFIPLFHTVDTLNFAGYSRFNLFILAPILVGSSIVFNWMIERKKVIAAMAVSGIILLNLVISPVNSDGSKVPYWGNYLIDISEHYYPYQEALLWIKNTFPQNNILFAGAYYPYYFKFYFNKLAWFPKFNTLMAHMGQGDDQTISEAIAYAEEKREQVILFQVLGKVVPKFPTDSSFNKVKIFQNEAHTLLVLYK
jgi:hypothetical protein